MMRAEDNRTIEDLAAEALQVQDACNLSGVVLGFGRAVLRLRQVLEAEGSCSTERLSRHPVCVLWSNKIQSLTGDEFSSAYEWANRTKRLTA